ncbi:conjugal transfer protein TraI [Chitinophaga sp. CC14]|uniref:conjugal transfer protein TraI n=1 Tax=Chitinophaga sp. CC14 TaxID=3029199 RepID=UPI003B80456C
MKKRFLCIMFMWMTIFTVAPTQQSQAYVWVIIKEILIKVLKALDLAVQRLQNVTVKLQNVQKEIENELSKLKLKEIAEWGEKERSLFKSYYDELWKVKNLISMYKRVADIIAKQKQIIAEYKTAYNSFSRDSHFSPQELEHIYQVFSGILDASLKNIDQLSLVVNSLLTQMPDGKRLDIIHQVSVSVDKNLSDLRAFTSQNIMISLQRAKNQQELSTIKNLYGLPQ